VDALEQGAAGLALLELEIRHLAIDLLKEGLLLRGAGQGTGAPRG
jgi:hypothetical protein